METEIKEWRKSTWKSMEVMPSSSFVESVCLEGAQVAQRRKHGLAGRPAGVGGSQMLRRAHAGSYSNRTEWEDIEMSYPAPKLSASKQPSLSLSFHPFMFCLFTDSFSYSKEICFFLIMTIRMSTRDNVPTPCHHPHYVEDQLQLGEAG